MAMVSVLMEMKRSSGEIRNLLAKEGVVLQPRDVDFLLNITRQMQINESNLIGMQINKGLKSRESGEIRVLSPSDYQFIRTVREAAYLSRFDKKQDIRLLLSLAVLSYGMGPEMLTYEARNRGFDIGATVEDVKIGIIKTAPGFVKLLSKVDAYIAEERERAGRLAGVVPMLKEKPVTARTKEFRVSPNTKSLMGMLYQPEIPNYNASFSAFCNMKEFGFVMTKKLVPKTIRDAYKELGNMGMLLAVFEEKSGERFNNADISRLYDFLSKPSRDPTVSFAQEKAYDLLSWISINHGALDAEGFHNFVGALDAVSTKLLEESYPADGGDLGRESTTFKWNALGVYIYLNAVFGPGAIKRLHDEFNIVCYGRYGPKALASEFSLAKTGKPLAIVFVSQGDNTGIVTFKEDLKMLLDSLTLTHNVRICEFASAKDLVEQAKRITSAVRDAELAQLALIVSHGDTDGLRVLRNEVYLDGTEPEWVQLKQYLAKDADVVINACRTGLKGDGFAQKISNALGLTVYAPGPETNAALFEFKEDGEKLRLEKVMFQDIGVKWDVFTPNGRGTGK